MANDILIRSGAKDLIAHAPSFSKEIHDKFCMVSDNYKECSFSHIAW